MADLSETNVDETIDEAIETYFSKGLLIDGLFWSRAIAILRDKIRRLENE